MGDGGDWFMGLRGGRMPPTHVHMHMHAHACAYDIIGKSHGIPPMGAAICMKLSCLPHMYVHVCVCVHVRACAHV